MELKDNRKMKEQDTYIGIEELLPRYCDGLTTDDENRRVEAWMEAAPENRKLMEEIHAIQLAADTWQMKRHIDTEGALKKVKGRIRTKISWWEWAQRVAAVLSIPLLIGTLFLYFDRQAEPSVAQMIEIRTNPGMTTSVVLPDSTVVCLNSETVLRYPSGFTGDSRQVELEGEAFFDVAKDAEKRFVVSVPHRSQIEVYGTRFNIEAYTNDDRISTTLVEGSVGFKYTDKEGTGKKVTLCPRQKLVFTPSAGQTDIYATSCESETAWKDGKIVFENTPMEEVLRMLGKRYNVDFVVRNIRLKDYAFTGTFTTQRLERIMEYFKISSHIKWRYLDSSDITDQKQQIEIY